MPIIARTPSRTVSGARPASAHGRPAAFDGTPGGAHIDHFERDRSLSAMRNVTVNGEFPVRHFANVEEAFDALACASAGPARVQLITDNNDKFVARWKLPPGDGASSYFTVQQDIYGYAFLGKLLMELRAGHKQRLLCDGLANLKIGFTSPRMVDYLKTLVGQGGDVGIYHEVHRRGVEVLRGLAGGGYAGLAQTHDKIMAKDGVGVIGGSNIGKDYFSDHADFEGAWRDTDTVVTSLDHQDVANGLWRAVDVELNHGVTTRLGPVHGRDKQVELLGAYAMMDAWLNAAPLSAAEKTALRGDPSARKQVAGDLLDLVLDQLADPASPVYANGALPPTPAELDKLAELADGFVENLELRGKARGYEQRVRTFACESKILDQTSAAGTNESHIAPGLAELVGAARETVNIQNPYVCLTEDEICILEAAARRGVKIKIGTNSPTSTDSAVTQAFFLKDWPMLLARIPGLEIYVSTKTKLHAKALTIDGVVSAVQTANADLISRFVNSEVAGVHKSRAFAEAMNQVFRDDLQRPENGVLQYRIKKDAAGNAVLDHGKPIVELGPDHHLPTSLRVLYGIATAAVSALEGVLPRPMRHPRLVDVLAERQRDATP